MELDGDVKVNSSAVFVRTDIAHLSLADRESEEMRVHISPGAFERNCFFVLDIYVAGNEVHPHNHVGWWKCLPHGEQDITVAVSKRNGGFVVRFTEAAEVGDCWVNPDRTDWSEVDVFAMHLVLRSSENKAIMFNETIHLYTSEAAERKAEGLRARFLQDITDDCRCTAPWYCWPAETRVLLVSRSMAEHDAVGNFIFDAHRMLHSQGVESRLYALEFDPTLRGIVHPVADLLRDVKASDVIVFNFSMYDPLMEEIRSLPAKKILHFFNITPPRFLQVFDAEYAILCAKALAQLPLARRFDALLANSGFAADALRRGMATANDEADRSCRNSSVASQDGDESHESSAPAKRASPPIVFCPPFLNARKWDAIEAAPVELPAQGKILLYVGRLAPHKRIEHLFPLFAEYHKLDRHASLMIAGKSLFKSYSNYLHFMLKSRFSQIQNRVHFVEDLSDGQLKTVYERSSAHICMSEHEGYCVPLVEAMYFGKPIFAYAQPAVVETLGRSGRVFHRKDYPAIAAEIHALLSDPESQQRMLARQRARFEEIASMASGDQIWNVLETALFSDAHSL